MPYIASLRESRQKIVEMFKVLGFTERHSDDSGSYHLELVRQFEDLKETIFLVQHGLGATSLSLTFHGIGGWKGSFAEQENEAHFWQEEPSSEEEFLRPLKMLVGFLTDQDEGLKSLIDIVKQMEEE